MRTTLVTAVLISLVALGCQSDSQPRGLTAMEFSVVDSLLGEPVVFEQEGFTVRPPLGWERDSSRHSRAMPDGPSLASFFADSVGQSGLHTSLVRLPGALQWPDQVDAYDTIHATSSTSQVRRAEFLKDGRPVLQYLVQQPDTVSFSLLTPLRSDTMVQAVYIVPASAYTVRSARSIESSIGSIQIHP